MQSTEKPKLTLEYAVRIPRVVAGSAPVLILLHGYGSNERDLLDIANDLPGELLVICARAPRVLAPEQFAWFDLDFSSGKPVGNAEQAEASRYTVRRFVEEVCVRFSVDTKRVFLGGFSQGAMLCLSVALTSGDLVRGTLPLSGRVFPEIKPLVDIEGRREKLKVFLAHGTADEQISIRHAHESRDYLRTLPLELEYHEYPIPHTISRDEIMDMSQWLTRAIG